MTSSDSETRLGPAFTRGQRAKSSPRISAPFMRLCCAVAEQPRERGCIAKKSLQLHRILVEQPGLPGFPFPARALQGRDVVYDELTGKMVHAENRWD